MAISPAQYKAWLEKPGKARCVLIVLQFVGKVAATGAQTTYNAFVSNMPYVTKPTDIYPNQIFDDCITQIPNFTRRMNEQLAGRSTQSAGDLIIANENGVRHTWKRMNWNGQPIVQYLGDPSWDFADFRVILNGVVDDVYDARERKIGFRISDKTALLQRDLMLATIGGSGPAANSVMPIAFGDVVFNISPVLEDAINLIYRLSATRQTSVTEYLSSCERVRENGAELKAVNTIVACNTATDTLTTATPNGYVVNTRLQYTSLTSYPSPLTNFTSYWVHTVVSPTEFKLTATHGGATAIDLTVSATGGSVAAYPWTYLPATGQIQFCSAPAGQITADIQGLVTGATVSGDTIIGGTGAVTAGGIIERLLLSGLTNTRLTAADIDTASLAAFNALCPQICSVHIKEKTAFIDVIDQLVLSVGGWWGFSREGKMQFGRLDLPAAGTTLYDFTSDDVARRSLTLLRRILPRSNVKMEYKRNWTPQTGTLAGSVSAANRALYGQPYSEVLGIPSVGGIPTITGWENDPDTHLNVVHLETLRTLLVSAFEAQDEANRFATMFQGPTGIYGFDTHQAVYLLNLGDLIYIEHADFTGYGVITSLTENVRGKSTVEFFAALPDLYPTEGIA